MQKGISEKGGLPTSCASCSTAPASFWACTTYAPSCTFSFTSFTVRMLSTKFFSSVFFSAISTLCLGTPGSFCSPSRNHTMDGIGLPVAWHEKRTVSPCVASIDSGKRTKLGSSKRGMAACRGHTHQPCISSTSYWKYTALMQQKYKLNQGPFH